MSRRPGRAGRPAGDHPGRVLLAGIGVPYVLEIAVALLAVTSMITVFQRIEQVRRQARAVRDQHV